jgi:hypothetical protein
MPYVKDEVKYIRDQFKTAFYGDSQLGISHSLMNKIENSSFEHAKSKNDNAEHSLWENTLHIMEWMKATLSTLKSGKIVDPSDVTSWPKIELSQENWDKTKLEIEVVLNTFFDELVEWDSQRLHTIINDTDFDYNTMLSGTLHHIMYHINQII